jgi:hypothetical protein
LRIRRLCHQDSAAIPSRKPTVTTTTIAIAIATNNVNPETPARVLQRQDGFRAQEDVLLKPTYMLHCGFDVLAHERRRLIVTVGGLRGAVVRNPAQELPGKTHQCLPRGRFQSRLASPLRERAIGDRPYSSACWTHLAARGAPSFTKSTGVPLRTSCARVSASQFVRRMHPCDAVLLILSGSGVPCIP